MTPNKYLCKLFAYLDIITIKLIAYKNVDRLKLKKNTTTPFEKRSSSSLIKIGKILNRPITKFYNSDHENVTAADLRLSKTRPISFNIKDNLL